MAAATSPATGQAYGVKRVCAIWGIARSSFYDAQRQDARSAGRPVGRRGPKPMLSDADLLAAIRRDLDRSPWSGEGHRKVWARLAGEGRHSGQPDPRATDHARKQPAVFASAPAASGHRARR